MTQTKLVFFSSIFRSVLWLAGALVVGACTQLTKESCERVNWFEMGRSDAEQGQRSNHFADKSQRCQALGVPVDGEAYVNGRAKGLKAFCTFTRGVQIGLRGDQYLGVCPKSLESDILRGLKLGAKEREIKKKEDELRTRERQLAEDEQRLKDRKIEAMNSCTFNSDCSLEGDCVFGRCRGSSEQCSFDSDCKTEGNCSLESIWIDGSYETVRACSY